MKLAKNHPFFTVTQEIDEILNPLKPHNIEHFVYLRTYADGSRIYLSNKIDPLKAYLEEEHYRFGYCESKHNTYTHDAVLWSTLPNQHIFQFRRNHFNLDHGISLTQKNEGFFEFYSFCADVNRPEVINFYLNNLDQLKNFSADFNQNAAHLIREFEDHKIVLELRESAATSAAQETQGLSHQSNLNLVFNRETKESIQLPHQLSQCFKLLAKGLSAKEIATKLQLSHRTVEHYIANIRKRLGCHSSRKLLATYQHFPHD